MGPGGRSAEAVVTIGTDSGAVGVDWTVRKKRALLAAVVLVCLAGAVGWWWHHISSPEYRTRFAVEKIRAALLDPDLARALQDARRAGRLRAEIGDPWRDLRKLGARAVPHLIAAVRETDPYTSQAGLVGLRAAAQGGPNVGPLLVRALRQDKDPDVRRAAAEGLWSMRTIGFDVAEALTEALGDEDRRVGTAAMEVLRGHLLRGHGGLILPLSVLAARDPRPAARWNAARILGTAGRCAPEAVPELIRLLADPHRNVRHAAAEGLGHLGPEATEAVEALRRATEDENSFVREAAEEALKKIRSRPTTAGS
jgi:HEAT repeat protein